MPKLGNRYLDASLKVALVLLVSVCVLDPASQLFGLKEVFFITAWIIFTFNILIAGKPVYISMQMVMYLLLFIFIIPITSVFYYFVSNGDFTHYDGYIYFKPYLFLTLALILYGSKYDLIKPMMIVISLLSILTIFIVVVSVLNPSLIWILNEEIGDKYGIFVMGTRGFDKLPFPQVFFHTSPLIVFALAYYSMKVLTSKKRGKVFSMLFLIINIVAMFLGATRSNMIFSMIVPMLVIFWYSKNKKLIMSFFLSASAIIFISNYETILSMLDPEEISNAYKLSFFTDYMKLFDDEKVLFWGQGLGSYFFTEMRGYVSLTELTYFEFIRRFGFLISSIVLVMLLYPLTKLFLEKYHPIHYIFISYLIYLIMCFSNPLLMSSTGMLLLSVVIYYTFSFSTLAGKESLTVH